MFVNSSILACVVLFLITGADGQEIESPINRKSSPNSALVDQFNSRVIRSVNRIDLVIRRALSGRQLRYTVGRYWVNQDQSLINEHNRKVGIWGIDGTTDSLPEFR